MVADWFDMLPGATELSGDSRRILRACPEVHVDAGTVLFRPGSLCQGLPIVMSGSVRVRLISETGREIVLYRVRPGQACIMTSTCLLANDPYAAEGIAEVETLLRLVPPAQFEALVGAEVAFRRLVFAGFATRLADSFALVEDVAFRPVAERLARILLARETAGSVHLTHEALAAELGSAREVVSRTLSLLAARGVIATHRGGIDLLDRAALRILAET